jgi:hypothetical protein
LKAVLLAVAVPDGFVQTDTRERDGHAGKAGMDSHGIASDAGAACADLGIACLRAA